MYTDLMSHKTTLHDSNVWYVVQPYHQKLKETWRSKSSKAVTVYSVLNPQLDLSRCYTSSQTFTLICNMLTMYDI